MLKTIAMKTIRDIAETAPDPEKECGTEPDAACAEGPVSPGESAAPTTTLSQNLKITKSEDCAGCRYTKKRWRTWKFIPFCTRYRVERNVRCLTFKWRTV
jgi:hypothetical protein